MGSTIGTNKDERFVGEQGFWRAVLIQTIDDYFKTRGYEQWMSERLMFECDTVAARWFDEICDYAGYSPDWIRRKVKSINKSKLKKMPIHIGRLVLGEWHSRKPEENYQSRSGFRHAKGAKLKVCK